VVFTLNLASPNWQGSRLLICQVKVRVLARERWSLSSCVHGPTDRAPDYGSGEWGFESLWARQVRRFESSLIDGDRSSIHASLAERAIARDCKSRSLDTVVRIHHDAHRLPAGDFGMPSSEGGNPGSTPGGSTRTRFSLVRVTVRKTAHSDGPIPSRVSAGVSCCGGYEALD
jgi:hypothetical protein